MSGMYGGPVGAENGDGAAQGLPLARSTRKWLLPVLFAATLAIGGCAETAEDDDAGAQDVDDGAEVEEGNEDDAGDDGEVADDGEDEDADEDSADEDDAGVGGGDAELSIGETVELGDFEHTFHGARFDEGDDIMGPDEGERWLVVDVEVANNGAETTPISSIMMWDLVDSESRTADMAILLSADGSVDGELGPDRSMRGEIGYEVDEGETEWELVFQADMLDSEQAIYAFTESEVN